MTNVPQFDLAVLCVEDERAAREELLLLLRRRAREVWVAEHGALGLELFCAHTPDLVMTDLRMPGLDGLQLARTLRELRPEVQLIATTAHSDRAVLLEAIEVGFDHYVLKPIEVDRLEAAMAKCAQQVATAKAIAAYQAERERLIAELQVSHTEVKTLRGILPICAWCKNVRDDHGYWKQVEQYVHEHTEADFSHTICPKCIERHYPEVKHG